MVEFGAGDGAPVISALLKAPYAGTCTAFELSPAAAQVRAWLLGRGRLCSLWEAGGKLRSSGQHDAACAPARAAKLRLLMCHSPLLTVLHTRAGGQEPH